LNIAMAMATVMLGLHYAVDLIATALMIGVSLLLFQRVGRTLID